MVSSQGETNEKLERLEDELNLLKTEVRQTLIDLREFIMKGRTIFPEIPEGLTNPQQAAPQASEHGAATPPSEDTEEGSAPGTDEANPSGSIPDESRSEVGETEPVPTGQLAPQNPIPTPRRSNSQEADPTRAPDAVMMSNIIWWLGTAKRRGMTLHQISPFIDAYEMSGYISPTIAKLIYRTMAEMDSTTDPSTMPTTMPQDFSEGLIQLNDILCTPNHVINRGELTGKSGNPPPTYLGE